MYMYAVCKSVLSTRMFQSKVMENRSPGLKLSGRHISSSPRSILMSRRKAKEKLVNVGQFTNIGREILSFICPYKNSLWEIFQGKFLLGAFINLLSHEAISYRWFLIYILFLVLVFFSAYYKYCLISQMVNY